MWSAGAVEPGLHTMLDRFTRETSTAVRLTVAVPAALRQRVEGGGRPDVLIAPTAVIDALVQSGMVQGDGRATVGRVGVGVAVRAGAPVPDISTPERFTQSLLESESLVYNRASTGIYVDGLLARLGVADRLAARTTRYADGAAIMEHLLRGTGREIGLGAITEIKVYEHRGVRLVGPLPAPIQNYTTYVAGVLAASPSGEAAAAFIRFVTNPQARADFAATGVE